MIDEPHFLTLNAGSSSVKIAAFAARDRLPQLTVGQVEGLGATARISVRSAICCIASQDLTDIEGVVDHAKAVHAILAWLELAHAGQPVVAVSHRVVHGGVDLIDAVQIDDALLAKLERLVPLAPLDQPHNLAGIRAAQAVFAGTPQVACFDIAFHRRHPFVADAFALPRRYYDEGIHRYGFHGLSYEYLARRLRELEWAYGDRGASGQRCHHVRHAGRAFGCIHHGIHCARRNAQPQLAKHVKPVAPALEPPHKRSPRMKNKIVSAAEAIELIHDGDTLISSGFGMVGVPDELLDAHAELEKQTGVKVYFCDPYSPCQRGTCENTNGLLRQYLPKGTDLSIDSQEELDGIADGMNTRPRATHDFNTPLEIFSHMLAMAQHPPTSIQ